MLLKLSRPPHPGPEKLPVDISAQNNRCHSSVSHSYTVSLRPLTDDNHNNKNLHTGFIHPGLPQLWKACTSPLFLAPGLPHSWPCCSPGPPPPAHPHAVLSLKGQQLHLTMLLHSQCASSPLHAGPGHTHKTHPSLSPFSPLSPRSVP